MPKSVTLTEFILRFRNRGGYRNSTVFTDAIITEFVNSSLEDVWNLLVNTWEDYYLREDSSTSTAAGTEEYGLSTDFYKLRRLEIADTGGRFRKLRPAGLERLNRLREESGEPSRYHLRGIENSPSEPEYVPKVILAPTPAFVRTLRITYIPVAQTLVNPTDAWDSINGFDELVTQMALLKADMRENIGTAERERVIADLRDELFSSAPNRDAGEPVRMSEHVEGIGDEFDVNGDWGW